MKPELILKADILDILFENRNKEYGAYELRSKYESRLSLALAIIFTMVVLLTFIGYWQHFFSGDKKAVLNFQVDDSTRLIPFNLSADRPLTSTVQRKLVPTADLVPHISRNATPLTAPVEVVNTSTGKPGDAPGLGSPDGSGNGPTGPDTAMMKKIITVVPPVPNDQPLETAEVMPQFPGGLAALQRFLSRNLKTPDQGAEAGSKTKVLVRFVVDQFGSVTGIAVEQSGGSVYDREVMRVMQKMPAWKPGKQNGRNVAVYFKIPVIFQADSE